MPLLSLDLLRNYISLISFAIGLPTVAGTYYQSWRTRQEAQEARQGLVLSENCLEFVLDSDGQIVNVVPLETLHTMPEPGSVVLLPGSGAITAGSLYYAAYRIVSVEQIYARVERKGAFAKQARLAKAVALVKRADLAPEPSS